MKRLWLSALCATGMAGATTLDFSVSYPLTARVGVSDLSVLSGKVAAGLSTRGADLTYSRGLALAPLGAVSTALKGQVAWSGGFQVSSAATGALGPVALNLAGAYFTTSATTFDPLAGWQLAPTDVRSSGWNADLSVRYRVNRQVVGVLGTELGGQPNVFGGAEYRRDLERTLPRAEGDDPDAPLETEKIGSLTFRAGARAGRDVLGATAGLSYATENGRTLALDAQLGPVRGGRSGLGLVASASFADVLGENSTLKTYLAYEPWRESASPLRAGLEVTRPIGPGTLSLELRGGQTPTGGVGIGFTAGYAFALGAPSQEPSGHSSEEP